MTLPIKNVWTCPDCGNREERDGSDTTDIWGCPNCGTEMRRRRVYPPRRIAIQRAGHGPVEINVAHRETR